VNVSVEGLENGFLERLAPAVDAVPDAALRAALWRSFRAHRDELSTIVRTFRRFGERRWPVAVRRTFMRSWHDTHLKMLPIYGLTCRLQKLGLAGDEAARTGFFLAAARNAATSYEDLNLEAEFPYTHSQLFDFLANAVCEGDEWRLDRHCVAEAAAFKGWVYRNMVAEPIPVGLYTNMFSEIFNHSEYGEAMEPFERMLEEVFGHSPAESRRLAVYIRCHVDDGVEEAHFRCVLDAFEAYAAATGRPVDHAAAEPVFDAYLDGMGAVMRRLEQIMAGAGAEAA
jgi:hypothetical protein